MKTISIGDLHGQRVTEIIYDILEKYDKIIFMGDYVDSFTGKDIEIYTNLDSLIELKQKYPEKIILLWGNHDVQYLLGYNKHGCTGYRPSMQTMLYDIFSKHKDLFQLSYQIDNTIWSHAGIHEGWYKYRFNMFTNHYPDLTVSEQLNLAFKEEIESLFDVGYIRGGIRDVGGPLWCDIRELKSSPIRKYNQIVGHNHMKLTQIFYIKNVELVFIDSLPYDDKDAIIKESNFYCKEFN